MNGSRSSVSTFRYPMCRSGPNVRIFSDNQSKLQTAFKAAMLKLSVVGQDMSKMIDCSEVIPTPKSMPSTQSAGAHLPAGLNMNDIEQAVSFELCFHPKDFSRQAPFFSTSALRLLSLHSLRNQVSLLAYYIFVVAF